MSQLFGRNAAKNWVDLLEHNYSLDGTDRAWLDGFLDIVSRGIRGEGVAAFTFDVEPSNIILRDLAVRGMPELNDKIHELSRSSSTESMDLMFRSGRVVATLSEYVWPRDKGHAAMFGSITGGPPDVLGVVAHSGDGRGVVLNLPLEAPRSSTVAERRRWMRGAAHIGAAQRLRSWFRNWTGSPELRSKRYSTARERCMKPVRAPPARTPDKYCATPCARSTK